MTSSGGKGQVSLSLLTTIPWVLVSSRDTCPDFFNHYSFTVISRHQFIARELKSTTSPPTNGTLVLTGRQMAGCPRCLVLLHQWLLAFFRLLHWDSHPMIPREQSHEDSPILKAEAPHPPILWRLWARWRPTG